MHGHFPEEKRAEEERDEFLQRPGVKTVTLKARDRASLDTPLGRLDIELLSWEVKQYGWGGCGNNLGMRAILKASLPTASGRKEAEVVVGPRPILASWEGLAFAAGRTDRTDAADLSVGPA